MKDRIACYVIDIPTTGARWQLYLEAYHVLTVLLSYHRAFSRSLKDEVCVQLRQLLRFSSRECGERGVASAQFIALPRRDVRASCAARMCLSLCLALRDMVCALVVRVLR